MSATALATLIKASTDNTRLKQLTRSDGTDTIDDDVLEAACERAIGVFKRLSGVTPNLESGEEDFDIVDVLEDGVFYILEKKKGRDSGIMAQYKKNFYSGCMSVRETSNGKVGTSSNFNKVEVRSNTRQDMDRNRNVFKGRTGRRNDIEDTLGY